MSSPCSSGSDGLGPSSDEEEPLDYDSDPAKRRRMKKKRAALKVKVKMEKVCVRPPVFDCALAVVTLTVLLCAPTAPGRSTGCDCLVVLCQCVAYISSCSDRDVLLNIVHAHVIAVNQLL